MNQKRSSGFRFLLLGIGGLVFISFAVIAGILINCQFFSPPDIQIVQPIEPLLINSGEGIILISHANSNRGIDRVEFLVNDSFYGLTKAVSSAALHEVLKVGKSIFKSWITIPKGLMMYKLIPK